MLTLGSACARKAKNHNKKNQINRLSAQENGLIEIGNLKGKKNLTRVKKKKLIFKL